MPASRNDIRVETNAFLLALFLAIEFTAFSFPASPKRGTEKTKDDYARGAAQRVVESYALFPRGAPAGDPLGANNTLTSAACNQPKRSYTIPNRV
jgi:hypothetical protein